VAAYWVDQKAVSGIAEMGTAAEVRNLSSFEAGTVTVARVESQFDLAVIEIDAQSIPFVNKQQDTLSLVKHPSN
jgi:hypothetical protein